MYGTCKKVFNIKTYMRWDEEENEDAEVCDDSENSDQNENREARLEHDLREARIDEVEVGDVINLGISVVIGFWLLAEILDQRSEVLHLYTINCFNQWIFFIMIFRLNNNTKQ